MVWGEGRRWRAAFLLSESPQRGSLAWACGPRGAGIALDARWCGPGLARGGLLVGCRLWGGPKQAQARVRPFVRLLTPQIAHAVHVEEGHFEMTLSHVEEPPFEWRLSNVEEARFEARLLPNDQSAACESASEFDPTFLRQFNVLPRRSAFGPHAE
jgi:hypothetical protein